MFLDTRELWILEKSSMWRTSLQYWSSWYILRSTVITTLCPGFGQDTANFHRTPGRGTAGGWGLTPPGQTEPGIPYHVRSRWVPVGEGGQRGGNSLAAWGGAAPVLFRRAAVWVVLFIVVFSPYLYRCCSCFPLFAVLLNCPYPNPPVFVPVSFHSPPHAGGGRGGCVALLLPVAVETKTHC